MTMRRHDGVRQVVPTEKEHPMTDPVSRLVDAIDRKDPEGIRDALAPDVRFAGMVPDNFSLMDGADTVAAKLADGIEELRVYCCGPRQGAPEVAAAYPGPAS
jgi:hypothetical protein